MATSTMNAGRVDVWINPSKSCADLLSTLRQSGWNPVVRSYGNSVPIAEVDGITFYGAERILANLVSEIPD